MVNFSYNDMADKLFIFDTTLRDGEQVPDMTPEVVESITNRYIELYENIVGEKFVKTENVESLNARIEENVLNYLKKQ